MPEYLSPGVYVEEVSSGIKPIAGVGTSTGAFVGGALKGPVNTPKLITNFSQFVNVFGGFHQDYYLTYAIRNFFTEGGTRCYVTRVFNGDEEAATSNWEDDDSRLRILALNAGEWGNKIFIEIGDPEFDPADPDNADQKFSITVRFREDPSKEPDDDSLIVETYGRLSMKEFVNGRPNLFHVERQINGISQFIKVDDLSEVITDTDPPDNTTDPQPLTGGSNGGALTPADFIGTTAPKTGLQAFDSVDDINIVAIPGLVNPSIFNTSARDQIQAAITYCENRGDCFFVADTPVNLGPEAVRDYKQGTGSDFAGNAFNSTFAALYYPWLEISDPLTGGRIKFPPSGSVAGIYSRTDVDRGVHKAPAGVESGRLRTAANIEREITKGEHDTLNPIGVNVIRKFPAAGIVVWGARTVSVDPEWRYVNVRRLFLFLEESIDEGTQWTVFEPNDPVLWARITRNISAFLRIQWSEGKLVGNKQEEAFFVKCDEETNPEESVNLGRVITEIGVAPSKPAEFVIFRISQKTREAV